MVLQEVDVFKKKELTLNELYLETGSGAFEVSGGFKKEQKTITVHYHKPKSFTVDSKILLVVPGAGRNGDSYRDAWVPESEKYGFLVLSLEYSKEDYPFEQYHLCGLIDKIEIESAITAIEGTNMIKLQEDDFNLGTILKKENWIFDDFDRVFDIAVKVTNSNQKYYSIFGHSAGGQILHRFALFGESHKVNHIFAANSGFFTTADFNTSFPFGIKNTPMTKFNLENAFKKRLIVIAGELDNQDENRGTLLRSPTVDQQGTHRLARAIFFYETAKAEADKDMLEFNWQLEVIPEVGHDHKAIGNAIAHYLKN
ncbi:hypothetical protein [uncultured Croceitalea sp.]|uniref:hypothetical protein n=1 Tax=uncultured Croceitalea sp. TaxID=1798908 RepID=UPI003305D9BC